MTRGSFKGCVGDDGLYMTRIRASMHRLLNIILIWGILSVLLTVAFAFAAYSQGQVYESLDLIAVGGNTYAGYSISNLLRIESAFCFVSGILLIAFHLTGFVWFYEQGRLRFVSAVSAIIVIFAIAWNGFLLSIGLLDPISCADVILLCTFWLKRKSVLKELQENNLSV